MNILFISYYYDPFPGVGAKRISYWANHIHKHKINATVLTATKQNNVKDNVIYIEPEKQKKLLSFFIKDAGVQWKPALIKYFQKHKKDFNYDAVLISGGPFMHFGLSKFLKKQFNTKVILDFRDPFSVNPNFSDARYKQLIKKSFESNFIKFSDSLIVVNKSCEKLLVKNDKPVFIINNGYEEDKFNFKNIPHNKDKFTISHAGTFIAGSRNPTLFLKTINTFFKNDINFLHYGRNSEYFNEFENCSFFKNKGLIGYADLIVELNKTDVCLIVTKGYSFESTTKIFDYIALNKKILIITEGELYTGEIFETVKNYPNVVWCKNNVESIKKAIVDLQEMDCKPFDSSIFSRAYGLQKMVDVLKDLTK